LPASSSRKRRLPWGCMVPLRDFNRARSTRWSSTSTAFPSSAFRTPSTACTVLDLPDVFQPGATYRVLPSGVSTSRSAVPAHRWPVPLGVALRNRYRRLPVRATIRSAALRALLHTRIHRPTPRCLAIAPVMIPSWDSPPPGSQLPHHGIA